MIEVAIAAVEAVFDWKAYLAENFGYSYDPDDGKKDDIKENDGDKHDCGQGKSGNTAAAVG